MELDRHVLEELEHRGEYVVPEEFVLLAERDHEGPGVERERLREYARALSEELGETFDADAFEEALEERLTDAEDWRGFETVYAVGDGRVSRYPRSFHDALEGSTDVVEYLRYLQSEAPEFHETEGAAGAGEGVAEQELVSAVSAIGGVSRERAQRELERARDAGEIVEDADQHPETGVRLADEAPDLRDPDA